MFVSPRIGLAFYKKLLIENKWYHKITLLLANFKCIGKPQRVINFAYILIAQTPPPPLYSAVRNLKTPPSPLDAYVLFECPLIAFIVHHIVELCRENIGKIPYWLSLFKKQGLSQTEQ